MKIYSIIELTWRGELMSGASYIKVCSSLEQAKETVKKEVDLKRPYLLCFKFSEDGTGAKASLCNSEGEKEEIRTFVSDLNIAPERLKYLDYYINGIITHRLTFGTAYEVINSAIEANKVKVMFKGTEFEHTSQFVKDDELKELWKFYEKVQYNNPPKIQYNDPLEIYYIDPPKEQDIDSPEKTSFF